MITDTQTEELRRVAIRLCAAVRSWDPPGVRQALEQTPHPWGLCVVLAAMLPEGASATALLSWLPDDPPTQLHPQHDTAALAGRALVLAAAVRDWSHVKVLAATRDTDPAALAVVLAAMVPDTTPVGELLAWTHTQGDQRGTASLRTQAA